MTITEFLLARIAEDEQDIATARLDDEPEWWMPEQWTRSRALAECEAKRRIVELRLASPYTCGKAHPGADVYHADGHADEDPILRALAAIWAYHSDYREEWRTA